MTEQERQIEEELDNLAEKWNSIPLTEKVFRWEILCERIKCWWKRVVYGELTMTMYNHPAFESVKVGSGRVQELKKKYSDLEKAKKELRRA